MPTSKRKFVFYTDERLADHFEAERARSGASLSELILRAILPPVRKVKNYSPDVETRDASQPVLIPR